MKLEKYVDKSKKKRKVVFISLGVIVLISVSLLLYKTFASFTENVEFPMMKGKVDYFGNSDIYFAFYQGDKELEEMPAKDNKENLVFDHGECDNGASIIWDSETWGPMVKNLSKSKTKCSLYFKEKSSIEICNNYGNDSALCYISKLGDNDYVNMAYDHASANGVLDNNLRYIGADPNNYIRFNNEKWRIIGIMKVKTENGVMEERLKIIREDNIEGQEDFPKYSWDYKETPNNYWLTSTLKEMLNGIYYNSEKGSCYDGRASICDFKEGTIKGINSDSKKMIDTDIIWNIGGCPTSYVSTPQMYECERGTDSGTNKYLYEWTKENDLNYHNGIGLIYVSDYSYATGGGSIGRDMCFKQNLFNGLNMECKTDNWLSNINKVEWGIDYRNVTNDVVYYISMDSVDLARKVTENFGVQPVIYLKSNLKIEDDSNSNYGSIENPYRLYIN